MGDGVVGISHPANCLAVHMQTVCVKYVRVNEAHAFLSLTAVHSLEEISKASQNTNSNEAVREKGREGGKERESREKREREGNREREGKRGRLTREGECAL